MFAQKSSDNIILVSLSVNIVLGCLLYLNQSWFKLINFTDHRVFHHDNGITVEDSKSFYEKYPVEFDNATAIFNTVHGALKQKNSNLFPIGVSFIPAYIPPNTPLYHATASSEIPSSFDWIALDSEFSYDFAHFARHKRRDRKPHDGLGVPDEEVNVKRSDDDGPDFGPGPGKGPGKGKGPGPAGGLAYMYTFRNTKPLTKLIYLEGASASKRSSGEMDQQLILSKQENVDARVNEYEAAEKMCEWGKPFGLEGIIRLEIGFEMILCDFHNNIEMVSNVTLNNVTELLSFPDESPVPSNDLEKTRSDFLDMMSAMSGYEHLQAGSFVDNGEPRVSLDFSRMVTPLNKTWINPDPYLRRINHLSEEMKNGIISELESNLSKNTTPYGKTDWQVITNHIVDKFGPMLILLNNTLSFFEYHQEFALAESLEDASRNLTKLTYNLVRRYSDDTIVDQEEKLQNAFTSAMFDFVYHTYPLTTISEFLIYASIYKVQYEILATLFETFEISKNILEDLYIEPKESRYQDHKAKLLELKETVKNLTASLRWSIFTSCSSACNWDEVCYIPTWGPGPMGFGNSWFEYDGERYRIGKDLSCVSYRQVFSL